MIKSSMFACAHNVFFFAQRSSEKKKSFFQKKKMLLTLFTEKEYLHLFVMLENFPQWNPCYALENNEIYYYQAEQKSLCMSYEHFANFITYFKKNYQLELQIFPLPILSNKQLKSGNCYHCGKTWNPKTSCLCSKCEVVRYCSKKCLENFRKEHSKHCKAIHLFKDILIPINRQQKIIMCSIKRSILQDCYTPKD
jgi:hypothetical protein